MPAHDRDPSAEEIVILGRRIHDETGDQRNLDEILLKILNLKNPQTIAMGDAGSAKDPDPQAFHSGIAYNVWKQEAGLVTATPGIQFNVPDDDPELKKHANRLLEPWFHAAMRQSQVGGRVWVRMPETALAIGRSWSFISPVPALWSDSREYINLVRKLQDSTDDADLTKEIQKDILNFKADNFPIRWRLNDARSTFATTYSGEIYLPEVVEQRIITGADFVNEYGEDALPPDVEADAREITLFAYCNHFVYKVVATGKDSSAGKTVHRFEHMMDDNLHVLLEGDILPPNEDNIRWAGKMYAAQDMVTAFDQIIADIVYNHHQWTLAPILLFIARDPGGMGETQGRPPDEVRLTPGGQTRFWANEEDVKLGPVQELNPVSLTMLGILRDLIEQALIRPARRGEVKAGESDAAVRTAFQIADKESAPFIESMEEAYMRAGKLHGRSPQAINRVFPDSEKEQDGIVAFSSLPGKKGRLELKPKDWRGWENAGVATADRAIPQDDNLAVLNAKAKVELGLAKETVLTEDLGRGDASGDLEKGREERLDDALFEQDVAAVLALSGEAFNALSPDDVEEFNELFADADPAIQQIVQQLVPRLAGNGSSPTGGVAANFRRTGQTRPPRQPVGPPLA